MTKYKREILEIINVKNRHLSAIEVYQELKLKMPKVVLATVYNNLNSLCLEGSIIKISIPGDVDRYDNTSKHSHLICKSCGKIGDIILNDYTKLIENDIKDSIVSYDLKVYYMCDECKNKINKN